MLISMVITMALDFVLRDRLGISARRTNVDLPSGTQLTSTGSRIKSNSSLSSEQTFTQTRHQGLIVLKVNIKEEEAVKKTSFSRPKRFNTDNFCQARADTMLH